MRLAAILGVLLALGTASTALGSADSNGPNGINSSNVTIVHGLDGTGIDIGQVDLKRPGDPGTGKDEDTSLVNSSVDPADVFYRQDNSNFAPSYLLANEVDDHALRVAGVMISDDFLAQGVVPEANLFSVGINPPAMTPPPETLYEYIAVSTNHIITHVIGLPEDRQLRAINMSILAPSEDGENPDGTSTATSYIDWSARVHDILYVVGNPEVGGPQAVLADNYNGMTVAFSRKNGAKYREVDPDNVFALDDFAERTFPDILAPGKDILLTGMDDVNEIPAGTEGDGTSFAAPHVTGTVAMLQQPPADSQINDLDLYFLPRGATSEFQALAQSISLDSTVDHIFFQVPEDGEYEFWVQQHDADVGTNQSYAVAWWAAGFGSLFSQGDFNEDGAVDGDDLTEWKNEFGIGDGADANGDGVTDGADFLVWQRNFGLTSATAASGVVPEPASCVLVLLGLSLFLRRGSSRCVP